ncbi:ABC-type transport system permease protein (probable substrate sugar) [Natrialba magadii ATCC 43099]|uniref:ABC-type transport system permease protein (Probable substrate sugar) n=1 Tax=Natrialba magadii (strain ATCC 43099 / DSM 3394 / CCM 3739 / CIP 104546 / IAM 13178 / JCM 8861 / NBRC 102185 / NCIMB 2190 / MS3) TaxID=547559 RepID=D3SRN1_NATMM|nr:sugar ABC transporter permease [Natrialba magadii]ADD04736.1 ABC-type transport system permease protein (probable substrate sugar) [Natrialba magadii ATCC 43099]ELY24903.1 binding-protein-dependent transport system inner membrane protein [Natrialba magadii ATCC 43099]
MSTSFLDRVSSEGQRLLPFETRNLNLFGLLLVAPGVVLFLSFMLFPIAFLVYLSMTDATHAGTIIGGDTNFVGFDNYVDLFTDSQFWTSFGITWLFLAVSLVIKIIVGLGLAMLLTHARVVGKRYMRAIVIIPMGLPAIFIITVWRGMFSGARFGPFNELLATYNSAVSTLAGMVDQALFFVAVSVPEFLLVDLPVSWLSGRWSAFMAYVTTEVWLAYPFMVIIIVSALQDVPMELHDAAKVDGAGYFHRFIHVTLPAVKRPVMFASILTAATSFQQFLIPWIFNAGGPSRQNELLIVYGYREAIELNQYAYASAIMVTAIAFIGLFMWLAVRKGNLAEGVDSA